MLYDSSNHISSNKGAIYNINIMDCLHPQGPMGVPGFQGNDGVPVSQNRRQYSNEN